MLASCTSSPWGRIWGACEPSVAIYCSSQLFECSCHHSGRSKGQKTWAAKCGGSGSSSGRRVEGQRRRKKETKHISGKWAYVPLEFAPARQHDFIGPQRKPVHTLNSSLRMSVSFDPSQSHLLMSQLTESQHQRWIKRINMTRRFCCTAPLK